MNIKEESIKYFIQLIQEEKVKLPVQYFRDIYTLSEYFSIAKFIKALDKISKEELFKDLDFAIQILSESEKANSETKNEITIKIKIFLSERINECIKNATFNQLPIFTIYQIFERSRKETVNQDLLVDFIFKSAKTHFTIFKFVELDEMSENKISKMIELIDNEDEETRKKCLEFLPFNISLFKNMKSKIEELMCENNQLKGEIKRENENKQHIQSIIVGGIDYDHQIDENPNNKDDNGNQIINLPLNLLVDSSSVLSFSVYSSPFGFSYKRQFFKGSL